MAGGELGALYAQISNPKQRDYISKLETTLSYKQNILIQNATAQINCSQEREIKQWHYWRLQTADSEGYLAEEACSSSSFPVGH